MPASFLPFRIGHGFDVHRFGEGDHLMLGGVRVPYSSGFIAHSDGDVVLHAVSDALLGACAQGDIGHHFPDTDPRWEGADSRQLLAHVVTMIKAQGYAIGNVDITIIAQAPKIAPHITDMRQAIADTLDVPKDCVSVKATTSERLGFTGREEGIATEAIVLLMRQDTPHN